MAHRYTVRRMLSIPAPADLFDDANSTPTARCYSQRALAAVVNSDAWLRCKELCDLFDAANNSNASVRDREGARLVSYSQEGAGEWLKRFPDPSVKGSIVASAKYLTQCQRCAGGYLSALTSPLDAVAAYRDVTQHERLGDAYINVANNTHRHNAGLHATFNALRALSTTDGAAGRIVLGDRGDGSAASKDEARRLHAHINEGHVPDLIRHDSPPSMMEFKCYSPFLDRTSVALGNGSRTHGGAASTADGGRFAFGNTEEKLRATVLGVAERGDRADGPLDRRTGVGWVAASTKHDYADALSRGRSVTLLTSESSGAIAADYAACLRALDKQSRLPETQDSTRYGTSLSSPQSFYQHHVAAISAAIVGADADTIANKARSLSFMVSTGIAA